jgi:hypothetical protein
MNTRRVREVAAFALLIALTLPSCTCAGYVAPDGSKVTYIPSGADSAQYTATQIAHYPLDDQHLTDRGLWAAVVAFGWPIPILVYRRRRRAFAPRGRLAGLEIVAAIGSAYVIYASASIGRLAVGTYLALAANALLLGCALSEARSARRMRRGRSPEHHQSQSSP